MWSVQKSALYSGTAAILASLAGCGQQIGIGQECEELHISNIAVAERARRGEAIPVALHNVTTPHGTPLVSVSVDDLGRTVYFIVTECERKLFFNGNGYPQAVVERDLPAYFVPRATGTYTLRTRGGSATATIQIDE